MSLYDLTSALTAVERADNPDDLYDAHEALYEAAKAHADNERRIAEAQYKQRVWAASPEQQAIKADRIANGLCVIETQARCITHDTVGDFGHHLSVSPAHSAQGIATND